jgi:hypothetical protein
VNVLDGEGVDVLEEVEENIPEGTTIFSTFQTFPAGTVCGVASTVSTRLKLRVWAQTSRDKRAEVQNRKKNKRFISKSLGIKYSIKVNQHNG